MKYLAYTALLAASALLPTAANASVTVNINQVGSDVVATASGSLNLTGLAPAGSFVLSPYVNPSIGYIGVGTPAFGSLDAYSGLTGPTSFGSGGITDWDSSTGDLFALNATSFGSPYVFLSQGYISGTALLGDATWLGESFASLGLTVGQYVYLTPREIDSVIINVGPVGGVPEPSTWAMMLLGFGAVGLAFRRRKQVAQLA